MNTYHDDLIAMKHGMIPVTTSTSQELIERKRANSAKKLATAKKIMDNASARSERATAAHSADPSEENHTQMCEANHAYLNAYEFYQKALQKDHHVHLMWLEEVRAALLLEQILPYDLTDQMRPEDAFPIIRGINDLDERYKVLSAYLQVLAFQHKLICSGTSRYNMLFYKNNRMSDFTTIVSEVWKTKQTDHFQDDVWFCHPESYLTDVFELQHMVETMPSEYKLVRYWVSIGDEQKYAVCTIYHFDNLD